jgi:DNA polymerase-3 subunit delta'
VPIIPLFGHEQLQRRFRDALRRGALPNSLLLHGPRGVGKQRLALWLGTLLLCSGKEPRPCGQCANCRMSSSLSHPDLHWYFPRPRLKDGDPSPEEVALDYAEAIAERVANHGLYGPPSGMDGLYVATSRAIVSAAALSPAIASRKVFVVGDAERMVPQEGVDAAANAFLKLLEEPPSSATIILTSSEPGALLPTICSRAIAVRVPPLSDHAMRAFVEHPSVAAAVREGGAGPSSVSELVRAAAGAPGRLLAREALNDALAEAHRLLEAAQSPDPGARYRAALTQGSHRARGGFTETLDALESLLHRKAQESAARGNDRGAIGASAAVAAVERAKELAAGNVSPQLLGARLLRDLSQLLQ